jgi:hypothetical protein
MIMKITAFWEVVRMSWQFVIDFIRTSQSCCISGVLGFLMLSSQKKLDFGQIGWGGDRSRSG